MAVLLRDDLAVCLVDGRPVFLDVGRDRYFLLHAEQERAFLALIRGKDGIDPQVRADVIRLLGLKDPIEPIGAAHLFEEAAIRRLEPFDAGRASAYRIIRASIVQWRSERRIRQIPLARLLGDVAMTRGAPSALGPRQREMIAAHRAAGLLRSTRGKCLSATLALAAVLSKDGCFPSIVLGVSLSPFQAHCWLQQGDVVLNDHPDRVRPFTPILVI